MRDSLPENQDPIGRLVAAGKATPARVRLANLGPPPDVATSLSGSEALEAERAER